MISIKLHSTWIVLTVIALSSSARAGDGGPSTRPARAAPEAGKEVDGFRLALTADKSDYTIGQPIQLIITLLNVGTGPVWVANATHSDTYQIEVLIPKAYVRGTDMASERAPLTLYGQNSSLIRRQSGSNSVPQVDPGQATVVEIPELNRLYDMTVNGAYTIVVRRTVPSRRHPGENVDVESNAVRVTLADRPLPKHDPDQEDAEGLQQRPDTSAKKP